MQKFSVSGIDLWIPDEALTKKIREMLLSGRYEGSEAAALRRNLQPGDRFLDLGAGAGYLASIAAGIVGGAAVAGMEAMPEMAKAAQANIDRNGGAPGRIIWGAVVEDGFAEPSVAFNVRRAFWASSIDEAEALSQASKIMVPAVPLGVILQDHLPNVLSVDIEGGELGLFDAPLPEFLRLIVMEIHPDRYGAAGVKRIFDGLSASGMTYSVNGSRGSTVVFQRVAPI